MCVAQTMARPGFLDPTFAEAMAALMAAEICCDLGQLQIQLKGDAKVAVGVVNSTISDDSCRGHLKEDIRTMFVIT
jgi:hypothetical protein